MKKMKSSGKKSVRYDSAAGKPSEKSGLPYGSFCGYWPDKPEAPGAAYPDGAGAIDGIFNKMHASMKKQWSDRLY